MGGVIVESGPSVAEDSVTFRLPDAEQDGPALAGARLLPALSLPDAALDFDYDEGRWELRLARPPVWRMEYRFQLHHPAGEVEEICDPANPLRAPGAFGDKSVVEFPDYSPPQWLTAKRADGEHVDFPIASPQLGRDIAARLWEPVDAAADEPLPLLIAHDGPEYDRLADLTGYCAAMIHAGTLPRHRLALLAPGERDEEYSANPDYALALRDAVLPALREAVAVSGPVVAMGASLGGLAMFHAHRSHPELFGGLFLQSASFLDATLDPQERRFSMFPRVSEYVAGLLRDDPPGTPVPVMMTCGTAEENLGNNRQMTRTLTAQGYPAELHEVPDAHNYVGWRDAFDPALTALLRSVWEA